MKQGDDQEIGHSAFTDAKQNVFSWFAVVLVVCANGCLAQRASTTDLKAAAAAILAADGALADGVLGDGAPGDTGPADAGEAASDVTVLDDVAAGDDGAAPVDVGDAKPVPDAVDADTGSDAVDADTTLPLPCAALDCDDGDACTFDTCDAKLGCQHGKAEVGSPCSDGNPCTAGDTCANDKCAGTPQAPSVLCDDGNPCTSDGCGLVTGCTHTATGGSCEDGNPCTVGDACLQGACVPGGNTCGCAVDLDCAAKDDGNACIGTLTCDKSAVPYACKIEPSSIIVCDAAKDTPCAQNLCQPGSGKCVQTPAMDGKPCEDGSKCTGSDTCKGGVCQPGGSVGCDDGNACSDDACDPTSGCQHSANAAACSDGNPCTVGDGCVAKKCKPGPVLDGDGDGATAQACGGTDCDDGNPAVKPGAAETCGNGKDDNCNGATDEGCVPLNGVGCGADGLVCGGGKGACSKGHCFWLDAKGYKWTLVPAGTFWMGCNAAVESGCQPNESPQHQVELSAYWIGVYEATVTNYKACVDGAGIGCAVPVQAGTWGVAGKEQHPMTALN